MNMLDVQATVGQIVAERPARARVFERLGIDYCCGGRTPLDRACRAKGLDPAAVLGALAEHDAATPAAEPVDWTVAPPSALADHIVATHHAYLRRELPRLEALAKKVAHAHGDRHRELLAVHQIVGELRSDLESHLHKEEVVLFPMIRRLESDGDVPGSPCGGVGAAISVMEWEHDDAGAALARLRELTRGFAAPADACNSYRALLAGLAELEADLHLHVHKENNILFPAAVAREAALRARAG